MDSGSQAGQQPGFSKGNKEIVRMIEQYLRDQGLEDVAQSIEKRTGVSQEDGSIKDFRDCITTGNFKKLFHRERVEVQSSEK